MQLGLSFDIPLIGVVDCLKEFGVDHWTIWVEPMAGDLGVCLPTRVSGLSWVGPFFPIRVGDFWPLDSPTCSAWAQLLMA